MEQINFEDTSKELIRQLEMTLTKLALAADAGITTSELESKSQKLAGKIKASVELFGNAALYKDVKGEELYSWCMIDKLPDDIYIRYANLCKRCHTQLDIVIEKETKFFFAKYADNIYINLADLPTVETPTFKVKIEGNTLMAVRADLLAKLPESAKKLLNKEEN
jgi:hypothetical protein